MDGLLPRLARPLLAALLALAAAACGLVPAAARADDAPPSARWPAAGSTLRTALAIGAEHWGMTPCAGRVAVAWTRLELGINARSSWANDVDPYLQPSSNVACEIALSTAVEWDWVKLCSIL